MNEEYRNFGQPASAWLNEMANQEQYDFDLKEEKLMTTTEAPKLCLHTGSGRIDRGALEMVPTPEPTATHVPIAHADLLGYVEKALGMFDIHVISEDLAISPRGDKFFGVLGVRPENTESYALLEDEYRACVGLRNSHNKSLRAGLCIGSSVFVCDNLSFSGDFVLSRKHTRKIVEDIWILVLKGVTAVVKSLASQGHQFTLYRDTNLKDEQANGLMIDLWRNGAIPTGSLGAVVKNYYEPELVNPKYARTVWGVMQSVTWCLKPAGSYVGWGLPRRTLAMHEVLDDFCIGQAA